MTKQEFIVRLDGIRKPLIEKYSAFLYYIASDVFNISAMEKVCEARGFTTKREKYYDGIQVYSVIYKGDKIVGTIDNQGLPHIEIGKRLRKKYATLFLDVPEIIEPIVGVHRVLSWHTVKGKFHCLAGGQTILNFLPVDITDEMMQKFLTETKLIDKVHSFKIKEVISNQGVIDLLKEQGMTVIDEGAVI